MSFLITDAMAAASTANPAAANNSLGSLLMLAGFLVIFYFLVWRPQSKRTRDHRNMVSGLQKGDEVVTSGGLMGKIAKVGDSFIKVAITDEIEIKVQKSAVAAVLPKGSLKSFE